MYRTAVSINHILKVQELPILHLSKGGTQITIQGMEQVFLFIRIISYSVGIINLVVMAILYLLSRERSIFLSIILMIPFTIVLIGETWMTYLRINNIQGGAFLFPYLLTTFGIALMIYVLPYFSHAMVDENSGKPQKLAFAITACISFLLGISGIFNLLPTFIVLFQNIFLVISITYAAVYGIIMTMREKDTANPEITRIATIVAKSMVIFLPLLIIFDFFSGLIPIVHNNVPSSVTVLPFFYIFWNSLLLVSCAKNLKKSAQPKLDSHEASAHYGLTDRETDVLQELIQGKSYAEIADVLCVSLATVKTHINRIYKKTETKSRAELMRRMLG